MTAINYAELALIELEYSAADRSARLLRTSDAFERADLSLRLRTILTAITALRLAMDVTRVAFDPEATARPASPASESSVPLRRQSASARRRLAT
jgi:hypothetical protein